MGDGYRPRYHVPTRHSEMGVYPAMDPVTVLVFLVEGGFRNDPERRPEAVAFLMQQWSMNVDEIEAMVLAAQDLARSDGISARDAVLTLMRAT